MDIARLVTEGLAAFFPVYDEGNVTYVITKSGKEFPIKRTCKTVLKKLARFYNVDLAAIREYYGKAVNKKQGVPIPMTTDLLLIPVKAREKPLGENDGTFGYVNFREIKELEDGAGRSCRIIFHSGKELKVLVSLATMREYIKNAQLVENIFLKRHFEGYKGECCDRYVAALDDEENIDDPLREYILKLILESAHLIRRQKNQAAK